MKTKKLLLTVLLVTMPLLIFAQEWDDIYADPSRNESVTVQKKQDSEPQKKKVVIVQGDVSNMEVVANGRDLDEYNRRGNTDETLQNQSDDQLKALAHQQAAVIKYVEGMQNVKELVIKNKIVNIVVKPI